MAQARSNIPTIAQKLDRPKVSNSPIKSYGYTSYDEYRPGYVNADRRAGSGWGALASSLSGFYSSFNKFANDEKDRYIEKGIAEGRLRYEKQQDTEEMLRNKRTFKKFCEANPEYQNDNPWVEVGYEQSRLRELGVEYTSGLMKSLDENGAFNQKDPAVVQSHINGFTTRFYAEAGLEDYENKVLMAEHFSPIVAQARATATSSYNTYRKNQRQEMYQTQIASEVSTKIEELLPACGDGVSFDGTKLAELSTSLVANASENGMMDASIPKVLTLAIGMAYDRTKDRDLLSLMDTIKVGDVPLRQTEEGNRWYSTVEKIILKEDIDAAKAAAKSAEDAGNLISASQAADIAQELHDGKRTDVDAYLSDLFPEASNLQMQAVKDKITKQLNKLNGFTTAVSKGPARTLSVWGDILTIQEQAGSTDAAIRLLEERYEQYGDSQYLKAAQKLFEDQKKGIKANEKYSSKVLREGHTKVCATIKGSVTDILKQAAASNPELGEMMVSGVGKTRLLHALNNRLYKDFHTEFDVQLSMRIQAATKAGANFTEGIPDAIIDEAQRAAIETIDSNIASGFYTRDLDPRQYIIPKYTYADVQSAEDNMARIPADNVPVISSVLSQHGINLPSEDLGRTTVSALVEYLYSKGGKSEDEVMTILFEAGLRGPSVKPQAAPAEKEDLTDTDDLDI